YARSWIARSRRFRFRKPIWRRQRASLRWKTARSDAGSGASAIVAEMAQFGLEDAVQPPDDVGRKLLAMVAGGDAADEFLRPLFARDHIRPAQNLGLLVGAQAPVEERADLLHQPSLLEDHILVAEQLAVRIAGQGAVFLDRLAHRFGFLQHVIFER